MISHSQPPVGARGNSLVFLKRFGQGTVADEAGLRRDLLHRKIGLSQELLGIGKPYLVQIIQQTDILLVFKQLGEVGR